MHQEKTFDTGHVKLNYMDCGAGSAAPLVMLHGGAWCWQEFLSLIPSLSKERRVCALDLRGNGRSGWAESYRLQDFAEDNAEFVRHLDGPVMLLGHSLGGVAALMAAARYPERVKALLIEDVPLNMDNYKLVVDSCRKMFNVWLDLKKSAQSEQELSWALAEEYKNYPGVTSAWILFFAGCLWRLDPNFFNALLYDFDGFAGGYDAEMLLRKIKCPVLFIRGERELGAVMTDDEISWLEKDFGNVTCVRIKGVGHLLHLQDQGQEPVLRQIVTFLKGI
jgi:pimeloyl-ACP methyl ester carboxylesterase